MPRTAHPRTGSVVRTKCGLSPDQIAKRIRKRFLAGDSLVDQSGVEPPTSPVRGVRSTS